MSNTTVDPRRLAISFDRTHHQSLQEENVFFRAKMDSVDCEKHSIHSKDMYYSSFWSLLLVNWCCCCSCSGSNYLWSILDQMELFWNLFRIQSVFHYLFFSSDRLSIGSYMGESLNWTQVRSDLSYTSVLTFKWLLWTVKSSSLTKGHHRETMLDENVKWKLDIRECVGITIIRFITI